MLIADGSHALLSWLLEPENPSARYLALSELLDRAPDDTEVMATRAAITRADPTRAILNAQFPGSDSTRTPTGYWVKPDVGYSPKYRATVWQVIFLAQLGAPSIEPIRRACEYVLEHSRRLTDGRGNRDGRFVAGKTAQTAINCLNGNLRWALGRFGYADDSKVIEARQTSAQAIVRNGFACHYNADLPCAWGDVKLLRAFLEVPSSARSAEVTSAIQEGVAFLLSAPLIEASYPTPTRVSENWFKLGFPLGYRADVLEAMTVLAMAGYGDHAYIQASLDWLLARRDERGLWRLERLPGKMWASFGQIGRPNKWVTLRALHLLKMLNQLQSFLAGC